MRQDDGKRNMEMRPFVRTLCLTSLAVAAAFSSAATAQSTKKQAPPKSATNKVPPLEPTIPEPAPTPPAFAPVFWAIDKPVTAYVANDAASVFAWMEKQLASLPGKPDQFSTADEKQKYEVALAERVQTIGPLPIIHDCKNKKYDADKQSYEFKLSAFAIKDPSLKNPNPEALGLLHTLLGHGAQVKDTYTAQNAYGASLEVSRTVIQSFELAFVPGASNEPSSAWVAYRSGNYVPTNYASQFGHYAFSFPMPSADAREHDKNLACLLVVSIIPPGMFNFTERNRPTRDLPFERTSNVKAFTGKLDTIAVVNKVTGQVYARASRDGF